MSIILETIFDIGFNRKQHIPKFKEWINNGYIEMVSINKYPKEMMNRKYFKSHTLEEKLDCIIDLEFDVIYIRFNEIIEFKISFGLLHFHQKYSYYSSGIKEYIFLEDKELQENIVNSSQWLANEIGAKKFFFTTDMWNDNIDGDYWKVDYNTILTHGKKPNLNEDLGYNFYK